MNAQMCNLLAHFTNCTFQGNASSLQLSATIRFEVVRGALSPRTELKPCVVGAFIPQFESATESVCRLIPFLPSFLPFFPTALPGDDGVAGDWRLLALLPRLRPREVDGA